MANKYGYQRLMVRIVSEAIKDAANQKNNQAVRDEACAWLQENAVNYLDCAGSNVTGWKLERWLKAGCQPYKLDTIKNGFLHT